MIDLLHTKYCMTKLLLPVTVFLLNFSCMYASAASSGYNIFFFSFTEPEKEKKAVKRRGAV